MMSGKLIPFVLAKSPRLLGCTARTSAFAPPVTSCTFLLPKKFAGNYLLLHKGFKSQSAPNQDKTSDLAKADIVTFDVGGKIHKVSRNLLDEHSDSMLSKLASDASDKKSVEAVFIDRDGDFFAHVLNYLRYGSIELPSNIPRSMFERELDHYGIKDSLVDSVNDQVHFPRVVSDASQKLEQTKQKFEQAKLHYDMLLLAQLCHHKFYHSKAVDNGKDVMIAIRKIKDGKEMYEAMEKAQSGTSEAGKAFRAHLKDYFGLVVVGGIDDSSELKLSLQMMK